MSCLTAHGQVDSLKLNIAELLEGPLMTWKTPKIIEIALGAEINSYACADLT